jgi:hypothetical protein
MAHGKRESIAAHEARKAGEAILAVLKDDGDEAPPIDAAADYSGQTRLRLPRSLRKGRARSMGRKSTRGEGKTRPTIAVLSLDADVAGARTDDVRRRSLLEHVRDPAHRTTERK